jgi:hypothetical protein
MHNFGVFVVVNAFFDIFIHSIKTHDEKLIENYLGRMWALYCI